MTEWGKLTFKVVRIETAGQELLALAGKQLEISDPEKQKRLVAAGEVVT